ncbi:MAG TPA: glutathione S-transferase [Caulobacteraceae bacterium]|jgi:glutathione S-transferase
MLKLFWAPGACSTAPHIVLEEIGEPFEPVKLNLREGDQRKPEFLALNPKGRVPALVTERGVLTENPAILAYLAHAFPESALAPVDDPWAMGQVNSFNNFLSSGVHVAFAHAFRPERYGEGAEAAEAMKRRAPHAVAELFAIVEEKLTGEWVHGDSYTISDPYLLVFTRWAMRGFMDMALFPALTEHARRVAARPAAQRAFAREEITLE